MLIRLVVHHIKQDFDFLCLSVALSESVWVPLDLPALVTEHVPDPPDRVFWKAVLLLPSDDESVASLADR